VEPTFLGMNEVVAIHRDQIRRYGGSGGVRDIGLLESAVAMPAATFDDAYLHTDLFEMAAAYLFHITGNHPFVDGNKRVGAVAAVVFLALNGYEVDADEGEFEDIVMAVAEARIDKPSVAEFFRRNSTETR